MYFVTLQSKRRTTKRAKERLTNDVKCPVPCTGNVLYVLAKVKARDQERGVF